MIDRIGAFTRFSVGGICSGGSSSSGRNISHRTEVRQVFRLRIACKIKTIPLKGVKASVLAE